MWSEPYLETCCRAALHRAYLCGESGRPSGQLDDSCLKRLSAMGLCRRLDGGRYAITHAGRQRHATEILRRPVGATAR
ncbi:MAG TPA: hypothetical protein VGC09_08520 [Rhodopila sp.]